MLTEHDPTQHSAAKRFYPYKKTQIVAECRNPFGFWYLSLQNGKLPAALNGAYTSIMEVERKLKDFIDNVPAEETEEQKED